MALRNLKMRSRRKSRRDPVEPPPRWPVDAELTRQVLETRRRMEHTRRQLELHVLPRPERKKPHAAA